jgi:hypothetical protein
MLYSLRQKLYLLGNFRPKETDYLAVLPYN